MGTGWPPAAWSGSDEHEAGLAGAHRQARPTDLELEHAADLRPSHDADRRSREEPELHQPAPEGALALQTHEPARLAVGEVDQAHHGMPEDRRGSLILLRSGLNDKASLPDPAARWGSGPDPGNPCLRPLRLAPAVPVGEKIGP